MNFDTLASRANLESLVVAESLPDVVDAVVRACETISARAIVKSPRNSQSRIIEIKNPRITRVVLRQGKFLTQPSHMRTPDFNPTSIQVEFHPRVLFPFQLILRVTAFFLLAPLAFIYLLISRKKDTGLGLPLDWEGKRVLEDPRTCTQALQVGIQNAIRDALVAQFPVAVRSPTTPIRMYSLEIALCCGLIFWIWVAEWLSVIL